MVTGVKQHIKLNEDGNLLEAQLIEYPTNAYLVANLAFLDGAEATAEHYCISMGAVYAAMSFYEDNRDAIQQALKNEEDALYKMGMRDTGDLIAEIKQRK